MYSLSQATSLHIQHPMRLQRNNLKHYLHPQMLVLYPVLVHLYSSTSVDKITSDN